MYMCVLFITLSTCSIITQLFGLKNNTCLCMGCRLNFNICFKARALEFTYIENIYRKCDHFENVQLNLFTKCKSKHFCVSGQVFKKNDIFCYMKNYNK